MTVDSGYHPVSRSIGVGATDDIDVILARARSTQHGVATPYGPRDNFRAVVAEASGDFREKSIVANHHTHLTKAGFENRVRAPRRQAAFNLAARQANFAVFAR